ncbi:hypothetical protein SHELI_v1c10070 [Spiroplasma helicoides]|uniref:Spiralin-like protein n=1 Tax=Spiroplasma helicoides TaxID=216938 RepID=A0A1B3SLZ9_9MOLU|nr:lipoprotein [Spiroplasma helicoides]AOG60954.1 hypothetical protein SHELI_v1c10070 [Spiroplasma helicoides]
MKKLLSLLAATGLVATSSSVAVACNKKADDKKTEETTTTIKDLSTLSGDKLNITPEDDTQDKAEEAVIAQIKKELGVDVVKATDVTFDGFKKAEKETDGSIKVTAASTSKLVKGTVTFVLKQKAAEPEEAKKPVITLEAKSLSEGALDIKADNSTLTTVTIKVANPVSEKSPKATLGSETDKTKLVIGEVTGKAGQESYTFTLKATEQFTNFVSVTVSYDNAESVTLKVTAKNA